MHAVVAFVLVCLAGWLLFSALGRARSASAVRAGGGKRGGQRTVRQEAKIAWEKVLATDWLEERRHERKSAPAGDTKAVTEATPAAGKATLLLRQVRDAVAVPFQRRPAAAPHDPGCDCGLPACRSGWADDAPPISANGASPVPRPSSSPASPAPPGGTTVASTGSAGAVEQFVEGVNHIHASAQAGGLHAKHSAVKACHEACVRFAAMAAMLARQMSEPGMNYGTEITEPIAKSATQLQASAMTFSEADAALTSLENMTVGDLAQSSRQAPHHTELTESGSH